MQENVEKGHGKFEFKKKNSSYIIQGLVNQNLNILTTLKTIYKKCF